MKKLRQFENNEKIVDEGKVKTNSQTYNGDDVRDAVARVDHCTRQCAFLDLLRGPRSCQCEYCLYKYIYLHYMYIYCYTYFYMYSVMYSSLVCK